jgi:hypothetical protein
MYFPLATAQGPPNHIRPPQYALFHLVLLSPKPLLPYHRQSERLPSLLPPFPRPSFSPPLLRPPLLPMNSIAHYTGSCMAGAGLGLFEQKSPLIVAMPIVTAFKFCIGHRKNGLLNR